MPDWRRLVGRRLSRGAIAPRRREEIGRELAGFLEDSYEERVSRGERPRAAARGAIAGAGRWSDVVRELERVEGLMASRLKSLWLPGVVLSVTAIALLRAVGPMRGGLIRVQVVPHVQLLFFWPWLLALPVLGALGAAWSQRQRGGRLESLLVTLFPAFTLGVLFSISVVLLLQGDAHLGIGVRLLGLVFRLLNFVLLPAAALLLGGLPVLWRMRS